MRACGYKMGRRGGSRGGSSMTSQFAACWLLQSLVVGLASGGPLIPYPLESRPISLVADLTSRLDSIGSKIQEQRLPLPTPQDLEAIKKVAQILVMLGEQVIPTIIGEPGAGAPSCGHSVTTEDIPSDPVNDRRAP